MNRPSETVVIAVLLAFPVVFAAMWGGVCFLLATLGGWRRMAALYGRAPEHAPQWASFQTGWLGWVNYRGVLRVGADRNSLHLAVLPLFVGHPRFSVRWEDFTVTPRRIWFSKGAEVRFHALPHTRLLLIGRGAELALSRGMG